MDPAAAARSIEEQLRAQGTPERAAGSRRYLKSDLDFVGVPVPAVRAAIAGWSRAQGDVSRQDAIALAGALWETSIFERKLAAVVVLERFAGLLTTTDLPFVNGLIEDSETWALVDGLAVNVAGTIVATHPCAARELDSWANASNHWVRRTALLALMKSMKRGDQHERFFRYADGMLDEKEFFIRKAIGWVLREVGRSYPDAVFGWLEPRAARASGVTLREAVKHLSEDQRGRILEARAGADN